MINLEALQSSDKRKAIKSVSIYKGGRTVHSVVRQHPRCIKCRNMVSNHPLRQFFSTKCEKFQEKAMKISINIMVYVLDGGSDYISMNGLN